MSDLTYDQWIAVLADMVIDELVSRNLMPRENFAEGARVIRWELSAQLAMREAGQRRQPNSN